MKKNDFQTISRFGGFERRSSGQVGMGLCAKLASAMQSIQDFRSNGFGKLA
jgi:hypothetical protein